MTQTRLNELLEKANDDLITLSQVAEICGAALQSNSKHAKDIKDLLTKLNNRLDNIEQKINYLYENNSPIFAAVLEDEKED
jgi:ABC-type transporter Mla subunit MlaD